MFAIFPHTPQMNYLVYRVVKKAPFAYKFKFVFSHKFGDKFVPKTCWVCASPRRMFTLVLENAINHFSRKISYR